MNFKINLDFCVIPSPNGFKNLVFITYSGENNVDENLCLEEEYELVRHFFVQHGYIEIDFCVFESPENPSIHIEEFKTKLINVGMKYSKQFEFNTVGQRDSFYRALLTQQGALDSIIFSNTSPVVLNKIKSKIPAIGEKITLYFYLFLQCHFVDENDCLLQIVGDLYSKDNNNNRNYLQIAKSDFVRTESHIPNTIMMQSIKTYGDFVNEISFIHKGNFKFVKPIINNSGDMIMKSREISYNIMEVKKNINPMHRITVEATLNQYYDEMINESKRIKKELTIEQKRIISLDTVKPEMISLKKSLKDKMLYLAETEEFEKANAVKSDISFIEDKIKIVDNLYEKNITQAEYLKTFCLNS